MQTSPSRLADAAAFDSVADGDLRDDPSTPRILTAASSRACHRLRTKG
jgi:hypothetical protein